MYKIAHMADIHIRNLKYHDEYRAVFNKMYESLLEEQVDYITVCGDIAHTKTQLSPEYFQLCTEFLMGLGNIAPTIIIAGNHDGNLKNADRQDAITPIINAIKHPQIHYLKDSGEFNPEGGLCFNVLSIFDRDNWVKPTDPSAVNIALYHGAMVGSMTGANWSMDQGDDDISIFRDFDFAMLGDIHRQQELDPEGRIRYSGSLVQQKFSESALKGYLLWEIRSKDDFMVKKKYLPNPRPFITVRLDKDGSIPKNVHVPRNCRLRLVSSTNLPSDKLRRARSYAEIHWKPYSITTLNGKESRPENDGNYANIVLKENLRDISVQETYIRDYLSGMELDESVVSKVLDHNKKYDIIAQQNEEVTRNVVWKVKEAQWDNLFNYGEKNKIDFEKLNGLVGIFGRNYSGKSSIVDSLLFTMFNTTSKGERKNVHVVNQNRERAKGKIQIQVGDKTYQICRNIEKYTKRLKGKETQEARVDLDFSLISDDESLNGTTRNETDANIRKRFGTVEDFLLTSMSSQLDSLSFVKEGSTKRKEILAKFLDLEIFDSKFKLAKKDAAEMRGVIKRLQEKQWDKQIVKNEEILQEIEEDRQRQNALCDLLTDQSEKINTELASLLKQIDSIPAEIIDIDKVNTSIAQKQKRRSALLKSNVDIEKSIKNNQSSLESSQQLVNSVDYDKLMSILDKADSLEAKIKDLESKRRTLVRDQDALNKKIKMLHNHEYDPDCVYCSSNKFVKDAEKAKKTLPKVMEDINELDSIKVGFEATLDALNADYVNIEVRDYRIQMESISECKRNIETLTLTLSSNYDKISLLNNEIEDMQTKVKEYEDNREAIENLETLMREKTGLENSLIQKKARLDKCKTKLQNLLVEEGTTKQILKSLCEGKKEMEDVEKDWIAYDLFMQCMHPNGIPYTIIKKRLPLLNEEISKILENIVDFEVFFINNHKNLDIMIKHPSYDPRPLSMGSGAEKTLASMAIRLALISITNLPKSELFILDEPATALDQDHMEGFTNLLRLIKNQFKTVILISHLDSLKDVVDMTIDIQKNGSYANVRI